jgi:hypothetical protein
MFIKLIVCRFGVPNRIITNNGSQFTSRVFQEYWKDLGIQRAMDKSIVPMLKYSRVSRCVTYDCLKKHGAKWIDELPCTLWGNRPSPYRATRETSFFLVHEAEAIVPSKVTMGSPRV